MKKLIYLIIALLAIFFVLRAQAEDREHNRFTVHPSLVEFNGEDSGLGIGFGLVESDGEKSKTWNIFPLRIVVRSGEKRFYLATNGMSFLTRSGINFGGDLVVKKIHKGDVISVGGPVSIQSRVEGSVWTFGADISVTSAGEVTGDVVAVGGQIEEQSGSKIIGNKQSIPHMAIPFLGVLTSPQSAETLLFLIDLFGVLLFLMVLFLVVHFKQTNLLDITRLTTENWKGSLLYLFLGIIVLPIFCVLLIVSVVGIFLVPVLLIVLIGLTYFGFIGTSARIGQVFMGTEPGSAVRTYLGGLLGFFIVRAPTLLGRLLSLLTSEVFHAIGGFLKVIGTIMLACIVLYGFGVSLVYLRAGAAELE